MMNITVYLGAGFGNDCRLTETARQFGTWVGTAGHTLVYGGSKSGLMGVLAQSVLAAGGKVIGVEPQFFIERSLQCENLTELIVTKDMAERRTKMIALGDAFVAFPGGTGTLEEIAEVMSQRVLGFLQAPCVLLNLDGYYEGLRLQLGHMVKMGLAQEERLKLLTFASDLEALKAALAFT